MLYSQPATSNGVVSGSRYRGVARISNPSAHDGVLGTQRLLIAGQACWARFLAIAKAITNKLIDVDDDGHAEYMSAKLNATRKKSVPIARSAAGTDRGEAR